MYPPNPARIRPPPVAAEVKQQPDIEMSDQIVNVEKLPVQTKRRVSLDSVESLESNPARFSDEDEQVKAQKQYSSLSFGYDPVMGNTGGSFGQPRFQQPPGFFGNTFMPPGLPIGMPTGLPINQNYNPFAAVELNK